MPASSFESLFTVLQRLFVQKQLENSQIGNSCKKKTSMAPHVECTKSSMYWFSHLIGFYCGTVRSMSIWGLEIISCGWLIADAIEQ